MGGGGYSVGQVAGLAGVSVRTLHHYERIGLLQPAGRTAAGYRWYTDADLDRLRAALFYRELGFPLEQIAALLAGADLSVHLRRQRDLLAQRITRLQQMLAAVDKEMEAQQMGIDLTAAEKFEIFGPEYSADHETEAERRWGGAPEWQQYEQRSSRLGKQDWVRVKVEADELHARMAAAMGDGAAPDSDRATDLAEEHRRWIETFYDCSADRHRSLGDLYVSDPRFAKTYDDVTPGLAAWLRDAIHANADRHRP